MIPLASSSAISLSQLIYSILLLLLAAVFEGPVDSIFISGRNPAKDKAVYVKVNHLPTFKRNLMADTII